jgi:chorismate mutase
MSFSEAIIPLRKDIDELDKQLFKVLKRRLKVVKKI